MFTGPVGPVEVFFYWPEAVFGNFYWPGTIGLPLASSPVYIDIDIDIDLYIMERELERERERERIYRYKDTC